MSSFTRSCFAALAGAICWLVYAPEAPAQTGVISQLAPKGELRAALIASNPVPVTRGADGQLGGVTVELARGLAARLGIPVRLVPYDNPARYNESLAKGEWGVGLAARDPARAEHLAFSDVFMDVDNGFVGRPGLLVKNAQEVDQPGIKVAVIQGNASDFLLTRNLKKAEIIRIPAGAAGAHDMLTTGRADVYAENAHLAHRIAAEIPGATVLEGRFNVVQMSIAVPKSNAGALSLVNDFIRDAKRDGLIHDAIARADLRGVHAAQ
jgi:polar amino acid transport system substrate-binding protein